MIRNALSNKHIVIWSIFVLGFLLRGYGLSQQPALDDEAAAASAAVNYLSSGNFGVVMWYHPPLRNIVIFLSGELFGGFSAWGLRFGSVLLGSLTVPALGYTAYGLFRDVRISALAAFFLCIDPLHISLSREAFQETTTTFFLVAGVWAAIHAIRKERVLLVYLSGALFGISATSKWHGFFPWTASVAAYLAAPWLIEGQGGDRRLAYRFTTVLAAYVVIPLAIYLAVYTPWLYRGNSLADFFRLQMWLIKHQYIYKGTPYTEDVLSHRAYQWFLWPVAWADFVYYQGKGYLNIAYGNFAVWVLTLPALVFAAKRWMREKTFGLGFTIALFLISYVPLILTTRSIWVFAAPAVISFAFILSAAMITSLMDCSQLPGKALTAYLVCAICVSALLYPLATFKALESSWARPITEMYSPHDGAGK